MVTTSNRYGLTSGSYSADYLFLTEVGRDIVGGQLSKRVLKEKVFDCAIAQFDFFRQLYEKLKNQRLRADDVLGDLLVQIGLEPSDAGQASEIFVANARYIGLIREMSGSERVISIEQLIEELPEDSVSQTVAPAVVQSHTSTQAEENQPVSKVTRRPDLHIDIQVHIDPTSSAEQIDQIFASMAKHLYRHAS